jgi:hypothetical protein
VLDPKDSLLEIDVVAAKRLDLSAAQTGVEGQQPTAC